MKITRVALDLAKNSIQLWAADKHNRCVLRKTLKRAHVLTWFREHEPCEVGMEACASAHYWARQLQTLGYRVTLLPPQYVKPFLIGQKNDANDAAAIGAAMQHPGIPRVAVKSVAQQDTAALHRMRQLKMKQRTALINHIRGLLMEYGIVIARSPAALRRAIPALLEDAENGLSVEFRTWLWALYEDIKQLQERVDAITHIIVERVQHNEAATRLLQLPGVGPLTASALSAHVGNARQFKNGRQMTAYLGLVPKQHSTGGTPRLFGIHKCGDAYLRSLLIHGARSVLRTAPGKDDDRSRWLMNIAARRHRNVAVVAQANKTARMAWAVLSRGEDYRAH
jgi:transposase